MRTRAFRRKGGVTLVEILIALLALAMIGIGTMAAFVAAARMMHFQTNPQLAEAAGYAQETTERFRNMIACSLPGDPNPWFTSGPTCVATAAMPTALTTDPLPAAAISGTESILKDPARRCYRLTPADCDGDGTNGDCYQMEAHVCWRDLTGCPCP
jgi:Tfp pilus assembly protein PilV